MVAVIRAALLLALAAGCATTNAPAAPARYEGSLPLRVEGLRPGSTVTVAGSFNRWDPQGPALREERPGVYQIVLDLAPGTHRFQLVVRSPDGTERWLAPPGLARYEPDGFGGRNGVVEITGNLRADGSSFEVK